MGYARKVPTFQTMLNEDEGGEKEKPPDTEKMSWLWVYDNLFEMTSWNLVFQMLFFFNYILNLFFLNACFHWSAPPWSFPCKEYSGSDLKQFSTYQSESDLVRTKHYELASLACKRRVIRIYSKRVLLRHFSSLQKEYKIRRLLGSKSVHFGSLRV